MRFSVVSGARQRCVSPFKWGRFLIMAFFRQSCPCSFIFSGSLSLHFQGTQSRYFLRFKKANQAHLKWLFLNVFFFFFQKMAFFVFRWIKSCFTQPTSPEKAIKKTGLGPRFDWFCAKEHSKDYENHYIKWKDKAILDMNYVDD